MPAQSRKQFKFFKAAAAKGDVSQSTANEFTKGVDFKGLPEKVSKKSQKKAPRSARRFGRKGSRR